VRFVRLWFVDVLGLLKSVSIPGYELEQALSEGVGLDGSSLESLARLVEVDVIAHPDPTTFEVLPWRPDGATARMFCDIRLPDGSPFPGDSRAALRRQLGRLAAHGYSFQVGPEIEFFLFAARARRRTRGARNARAAPRRCEGRSRRGRRESRSGNLRRSAGARGSVAAVTGPRRPMRAANLSQRRGEAPARGASSACRQARV